MQRGLAEGIRRGRGAGHRPQQVPRGADVAAPGRPDDVVAASEATGCPPEGSIGKAAEGQVGNRIKILEKS